MRTQGSRALAQVVDGSVTAFHIRHHSPELAALISCAEMRLCIEAVRRYVDRRWKKFGVSDSTGVSESTGRGGYLIWAIFTLQK